MPEGYPYKEGVTIKWDGNTEGLDAVGGMFYRVSDVILSNEQIKTGFIKNNADIELPIAPMWDELVGAGMITDDISIIEMVAFVRKDNVSFNGVVFGTAGVYFSNKNNHYATKFTNETIHPISPEFLSDVVRTVELYGDLNDANKYTSNMTGRDILEAAANGPIIGVINFGPMKIAVDYVGSFVKNSSNITYAAFCNIVYNESIGKLAKMYYLVPPDGKTIELFNYTFEKADTSSS